MAMKGSSLREIRVCGAAVVHTDDECDHCLKDFGKKHLKAVPFLFLDHNDKFHEDISHLHHYRKGTGYHQYYVCAGCLREIEATLPRHMRSQ